MPALYIALPADPVPAFVRPRYPLHPRTRRIVDNALDIAAFVIVLALLCAIVAIPTFLFVRTAWAP